MTALYIYHHSNGGRDEEFAMVANQSAHRSGYDPRRNASRVAWWLYDTMPGNTLDALADILEMPSDRFVYLLEQAGKLVLDEGENQDGEEEAISLS